MTVPAPPGGYYPQQEFYAPGWQPARPAVDGVAVAALVTGLLMLGPVAIVLGCVALARTRRNGTRGRALAVTGIVLGSLGLVGIGVAVAVVGSVLTATRPLAVEVSEPRTAYVQQLVVGHCLASLPSDGPVSTLEIVPCDQQHTAQVLFAEDLSGPWPGQDRADQTGAELCEVALVDEGVLDETALAAGVEWVAWTPTRESWRGGDRTVLCVAHVPGTPLTGSLLPSS